MRMVDVIHKKRNGQALTDEEIQFFVQGYTKGEIPDYQASAFMMAIYFQGMTPQETAVLTKAMVDSGETIDLSGIKGHKVDKHSTGGVGDKVTFIVGPLVASAGVPVAKMSGRGLGHTGGTLDKLEAIAGLQIEMSKEQFIDNVNKYKLAVAGQTGNLAPADKKLYALRDVTATVEAIPLIAGSIMSKKLASGADSIVLDVKTGSGAFMKTLEDSEALAKEMVAIGNNLGRKTVAIISDMNQPLGFEVGNANEIKEAAAILQGENVEDLRTLSLEIASHMTVLAGAFSDYKEARDTLEANLENGKAYEVFRQFVIAQGGDVSMIDDPAKLPQASFHIDVESEQEGFVAEIDAESIGIAAMYLGAGRATKDDQINHAVGITLKKKIGDFVQKGEVLVTLHADNATPKDSIEKVKQAYRFSNEKVERPTLIHKVIRD
ncbi:pyrimidine-nucleoside phosphorylase [Domibacillus sp. DTU_2020_1001157_1_SI_ALB_TIR_016]|uniref:pyrimidine-nucleoside phosphorylase n=1 Tax=Domibacillus sp. DTU_2020_1001157_1_SI_ALB_TIR_016 TaxID=3077789 RepID=UPI0028E5E19A|nr:pyrimidine-nucleoside phosphorylase [Domibacillus sp. DTU_2020_1001157_1_SI_ALB_TIR_016]WNS82036.1 pyrimidine-nucleoside phosphorylase [Domibacillus sp. DTU_2020_1001157_1_SI_ALB_TIR_016]